MHRVLVAGLAAILVAGCDGNTGPDWDEFVAGANAAEARWRAAAPTRYLVTLERECACSAEEQGPVRIEVARDGTTETVVNMIYADGNVPVPAEYRPLFPTVSGLFEVVRSAAREEVPALQVTYEPAFGYPTRLQINWVAAAAEDDVIYTITALVPL